jgi:hypothetical protein
MARRENNNRQPDTLFRKEDLTGKAEQSEAAIEQTERENQNKGADKTRPDLTKQKEELKEAPESHKQSR